VAKGLKDWGIALDRQLPYRTVFRRGRAGIYQTEIRHVAGYSRVSFFKNFVARGSQGFVGQSSPNVAHIVEQPSVLNKCFHNYNILPRSGVRAESLRVGCEKMSNFVTVWATL